MGAVAALVVLAAAVAIGAVALGLTRGEGRIPGATDGEQHNVVVVMTDDQDARTLQFMEAVRDQLQAEGTTFLNALATFPLCCPSRVSYLTGQYAHNHGVMSNRPPEGGYQAFEDPSGTLPEALQDAGYRNGHVGKYLNGYGTRGNDPTDVPSGWDEWWGFPSFELFDYTINHNGELSSRGSRPQDYETDVIRRIAVRFIRESAGPRPFFLSLTPLAPHTESSVSAEARGADGGGSGSGGTNEEGILNPRPAPRHADHFENLRLPRPPSFNELDVSDKPGAEVDRLDADDIRSLEARYRDRARSLLAVDELVGAVVDELRRSGELDNTVIFFTSDNGYLQGEHRRQKKGDLYEESVRVPLIMRGPGVPAGEEVAQLVGNVDLAPTILDIADAEPGRVLDGRSLLSVVDDPDEARERAVVLENESATGIRVPGFVYIEHDEKPAELYDLRRDPFQLTNVRREPEYAEIRVRLAEQLDEMRDCAGSDCLREFSP